MWIKYLFNKVFDSYFKYYLHKLISYQKLVTLIIVRFLHNNVIKSKKLRDVA